MAYTIVKTDGTVLTTIADGTINTTSTSIGLPGRNYAGYGQTLDTNFVHQLENFADSTPPDNPLRGQLWFNTNNSTMYICPTDNESNTANWLALTSTVSGGTTTFGNVTVTGNLTANNIAAINNSNANAIYCSFLTVTANANIANAVVTSGNIGTLTTQVITTGANTTAGTITGNWTLTTGSRLQSTYADLAERFEADQPYDAGTVVELGGIKEITAVKYELSEDVFGVVSNTAAYIMNGAAGNDITHPAIALGGRVKVKVTGKVKKNQRLVSAGNGVARAAVEGEATAFNIIGRSLEDKTTDEIGTVEAFVKIN